MVLAYAQRFGTDGAWGVAPILAGERFRAKGLRNFAAFSADADNLTNNGYDHALGYGVRLGAQAALAPTLKVGASWQSRIYMSKLDKYAGFFVEQGDLDIPSTFTVGLASDLNWRHICGAGILGGIGFTMSIFITNLAFSGEAAIVNASKIAILLASLTAGAVGFLLSSYRCCASLPSGCCASV